MTLLQIRVSDAGEAAEAAAAGVDAVELLIGPDPSAGLTRAHAVRAAFPGRFRLRFESPRLSQDIAAAAAAVKPDEIAFPFSAMSEDAIDRPRDISSVAILGPEKDHTASIQRARQHADAVMLEPDGDARLVEREGIAGLDAFASTCRANGLGFGLAGGLEAPDVARLLLLEPDVLGFDVAVRQCHSRDGSLDPAALAAIRALVPRGGRATAHGSAIAKVTDKIFVRDFEVSLAIGAYQAEHGSRQRVRFSVETDVVREPVPPRDMRDVFSYDVILETIRVLAERAHVTFVETLAEEVAASLLAHPEIVAVSVKVEKLDVVPGAVGIEILRRRGPA